jgi:hypothetical protein
MDHDAVVTTNDDLRVDFRSDLRESMAELMADFRSDLRRTVAVAYGTFAALLSALFIIVSVFD